MSFRTQITTSGVDVPWAARHRSQSSRYKPAGQSVESAAGHKTEILRFGTKSKILPNSADLYRGGARLAGNTGTGRAGYRRVSTAQ